MPHTFAAQAGQIVYLAVIVWSLWKGGQIERIGAAALGWVVFGSQFANHRHGLAPEYGIFIVDGVALGVYVTLAFVSDRRWTLYASAFQLLAVLTHCARMLDQTVHRWAYLTTSILWGYAVLAAVAIGTLQHMGRAGRTEPSLP